MAVRPPNAYGSVVTQGVFPRSGRYAEHHGLDDGMSPQLGRKRLPAYYVANRPTPAACWPTPLAPDPSAVIRDRTHGGFLCPRDYMSRNTGRSEVVTACVSRMIRMPYGQGFGGAAKG